MKFISVICSFCLGISVANAGGIKLEVSSVSAGDKVYETGTDFQHSQVNRVEKISRKLSVVLEFCKRGEYANCLPLARTPFLQVESGATPTKIENRELFVSDDVLAPLIEKSPIYTLRAVIVERTFPFKNSVIDSYPITSDAKGLRALEVSVRVNPNTSCPTDWFSAGTSTFHGNQIVSCPLEVKLRYLVIP